MLDIGEGAICAWNQELLAYIENVFGGPGKAIINHVEFELKEPTRDDLDPKSKAPILPYPRVGDNPYLLSPENLLRDLSDRGHKKFDADTRSSRKAKKAIRSTTRDYLQCGSRTVKEGYQK